jgi:hypothetical protein
MFSELDDIFKKYSNKNIIMKWSDRDFSNLLDDLTDYFRSDDDVTEFMATQAEDYANKYNIDFMEPEEFEIDVDPDVIPGRKSDIDLKPGAAASDGITSFDEIKRLKELAGISEKEEIKEKIKKNQVLTFNSEEDRDLALEWLQEASNYPTEVKKYVPSRLYYKPEDALSILFPTDNNLSEKLDERKFEGIVEILHRAINKNIPNSRTIKIKK